MATRHPSRPEQYARDLAYQKRRSRAVYHSDIDKARQYARDYQRKRRAKLKAARQARLKNQPVNLSFD